MAKAKAPKKAPAPKPEVAEALAIVDQIEAAQANGSDGQVVYIAHKGHLGTLRRLIGALA